MPIDISIPADMVRSAEDSFVLRVRGDSMIEEHICDGDTIVVEPWRASAFPILKDLMVDRSAFDRIIEAGGYISGECLVVDGGAMSRVF